MPKKHTLKKSGPRNTKIGSIEKEYGVKVGAPSSMSLGSYLKKRGFPSLSSAVRQIEKKAKRKRK